VTGVFVGLCRLPHRVCAMKMLQRSIFELFARIQVAVFLCAMMRNHFRKVVGEALDSLPVRFRRRLRNVAVLVEDVPAGQLDPRKMLEENPDQDLLMGEFVGVPETDKSVFVEAGPDCIVLYQKNIEAVCESDEEVREEIRLTVLHELGHYFGMTEDELEDV